MAAGHAERGILRILAQQGAERVPVGAGFLVSRRYALTCAHVVNAALGRDTFAAGKPTAKIYFDVAPGNAAGHGLGYPPAAAPTASVLVWHPPHEVPLEAQPEDIAVLELDAPHPGEHPLPLVRPESFIVNGYEGYAYGFPEAGDTGLWATGKLSGHQHYGWRQIDDVGAPTIAAGFSGGPFMDAVQERVLGMVVARHDLFSVSHLIPVESLLQAWRGLSDSARMTDLPAATPASDQTRAGMPPKVEQQQNVNVSVNVSLAGTPSHGGEATPAPSTLDTPESAPAKAPAEIPGITLRLDTVAGKLSVEPSRPIPMPPHATSLDLLRQVLAEKDHDALYRALFASPHQLGELVTAAGGNPTADNPTTRPLRLRLVCSSAEAAVLPWHCICHGGRRLGEAGWIIEVVSEAEGDTLTIALDNPLVVAPSDPTLPIGSRSHATAVMAHLRRLLADCRSMVPWARTRRELESALESEPDLIYLFAPIDAQGAFVLGKDSGHREAYPLADLLDRLRLFGSKPLVWLHLVASGGSGARTADLWNRLRPLTRLLVVQLTTPGKAPGSLASTLEWMSVMADGREEPAAVHSRIGSHRDTHLWLGGRSLRLSPCSDTDAALLGYIRASLIRLLLGRKQEKRQIGAGIREKPEGHLTLYGVCGDTQACVHDFPEQAARYIQDLDSDRKTTVETRPLPLTMRKSEAVRDEVARQLIQDLSISAIMPALEALRRIPVVPPDREDTFIIGLSWLLEPDGDFTPAQLPDWLKEWKNGLLEVLEKEQIPPELSLLVGICVQWPERWLEDRPQDSRSLQEDIDRVLDRNNPPDHVHYIEMQRPLSLLRAADLREFYRDPVLRQRLQARSLPVDRLVEYILERTAGRFHDTVDLIYSECKQHYADFHDSAKGTDP